MGRRTFGSLSGWIVFGGTLLFYVFTLSPGIESWDTGELQTDANALFVAHPTGFPLFLIGGWLFAHVFAFGDPAWRISLFSATAVSAAAALLASFLYELTRDRLASSSAGLVFGPIAVVWLTAVRADAHDLALGCTAASLTFALRSLRTRSTRDVRFAALALGAALATHPIALFALPAVTVLAQPAISRTALRQNLATVGFFTLPLLAYAYVPIRSAVLERSGVDPSLALGLHGAALVDDGAPSTPASFARYMLATRFAPEHALVQVGSSGGASQALAFAYTLVYGTFGYLTLALALVGFFALALQARRAALALAIVVSGGLAFAANYQIESEPTRYALAALWSIAAYAGYGAWWFANAVVQRTTPASVVAALLLATGLASTFANARSRVIERQHLADARGEAAEVAGATADGSVIVATWSYATPLGYAKYVSRTFGARHVISGWPGEYAAHFRAWKKSFGHVYLVVDRRAPLGAIGVRRYTSPDAAFGVFEYEGS